MPFDHFASLAPVYDRFIRFDRLEVTLEVAALPAGGVLLDAAGGTGRVTAALRPYVPALVLADISAPMLAQARAKGLSGVLAPAETLPFSDGAFERIILVDALHHITRQQAAVLELWRVLKPGGRLLIEEPDIRTFAVKLLALAEKMALMRSNFLPPQAIAALLPPQARVEIKTRAGTAWVIVEKDCLTG